MSGHPARAHSARQQQVALLVWWIFGALVTPIIRSCFYVSDTQPLRFAMVYYRKPAWRALEGRALQSLTATIYRVRGQLHSFSTCRPDSYVTSRCHRNHGDATTCPR